MVEQFDGNYCGLNVPEVRESGLVRYATAMPMLDRQQIAEIIADPGRMPARRRFAGATWIKNQGSRGSCQGYASAKALERARVLAGMSHVPLSGEYLYARCNGGQDNGSTLAAGMREIQGHGVAPESMVRWQTYLWNQMPQEARAAAPRFKADECYAVDTPDELASGLALGFVGVVAVHVGGSYSRLDSAGVRGASSGPGNHAVGVCDVRIVGQSYQFDEFGSWGLGNGQGGYAWLDWGRSLQSTIRYHEFYLIRVALDDSQGDNPPEVKA